MSIPLVGSPAPASAAVAAAAVSNLLTGDSATFVAGVGNWTASGGTLTRDTSATNWRNKIGSASLKWVTNINTAHIDCTVPGTFKQGVAYDMVMYFGVEEHVGTTDIQIQFGLVGTDVAQLDNTGQNSFYEASATYPGPAYIPVRLRWTPSANRTGVTIRVLHNGTLTMNAHISRVFVQKVPVGSVGLALMENPELQFSGAAPTPGNRAVLLTQFGGSDPVIGTWPDGPSVTPGGLRFTAYGYSTLAADDGSWGIFGSSMKSIGSGWWQEHVPADLTHRGISIQVGADYVGLYISEKDSTTIQIFDDSFGAYDIQLVDQDPVVGFMSVGQYGSFHLNRTTHALVTNTAAVAIANTETVVAFQSLGIDAMAVGTTYRVRAYGRLTSGGTAGTSVFRIRIGTTTLTGNIPATLSIANNASQTNAPFVLDALVTVRTIGASGTAIGNIDVKGGVTAAFTSAGDISAISSTVVVDTTAVKRLELTYISGNAGTTATFENVVIEVMNVG